MFVHLLRTTLVASLAVVACARGDVTPAATGSTAVDASAVRRVIDSANARYVDALMRRDAAAAVRLYSDDAIVMRAGVDPWRGRDAIRRGYGTVLSRIAVQHVTMRSESLIVSGDMAVETGTYELTGRVEGGGDVADKGQFLTVWRRMDDGSWKIARDSSVPVMPPASS